MSDAWKNFEPIFISILADTVQLMDREGVPQTAVAHFVMGSRTSIERKKEPIPVPRERTRNQTRAKNISQSSQKSTDSFIINDSPETSKTKTVQNSKKSVLELLDEEEAIEISPEKARSPKRKVIITSSPENSPDFSFPRTMGRVSSGISRFSRSHIHKFYF
jgi:hypothetical protein